jgi:hypothetical protein
MNCTVLDNTRQFLDILLKVILSIFVLVVSSSISLSVETKNWVDTQQDQLFEATSFNDQAIQTSRITLPSVARKLPTKRLISFSFESISIDKNLSTQTTGKLFLLWIHTKEAKSYYIRHLRLIIYPFLTFL